MFINQILFYLLSRYRQIVFHNKEKQEVDNQLHKHILVFNKDNEIVFEFKFGREMARFFQIDGKVAIAAIAEGEYQDFLLLSKEVSNLKLIYVFNSNTQELRGAPPIMMLIRL